MDLLADSPTAKQPTTQHESSSKSTSKSSPKRTFTDLDTTPKPSPINHSGGRGRGRKKNAGRGMRSSTNTLGSHLGKALPPSPTIPSASSKNKSTSSPFENHPSAKQNNNNTNNKSHHESTTNKVNNTPHDKSHHESITTNKVNNTPHDSNQNNNKTNITHPPSSSNPPPGTDVDEVAVDVIAANQSAFVSLTPTRVSDTGDNNISHLGRSSNSSPARHPSSVPQDSLKANTKTQDQAKNQDQAIDSTLLLSLLQQVSTSVTSLKDSVESMENRILQVEQGNTTTQVVPPASNTPASSHRQSYAAATATTPADTPSSKQTTIEDTYAFACTASTTQTAPPSHVNTNLEQTATDPPSSSPSAESVDSTSSWTTVGPKGKPVDTNSQANQSDEASAAQSLASMKSWVRPTTPTTNPNVSQDRNDQPSIIVNYRVTVGQWNKANEGTKSKFNTAYMNEVATQYCNYLQVKYGKEVIVIRVTPKAITGNGDNMKFSGTIEFSTAQLSRWKTDGFQATRAQINKELGRLESLFQRTLTTKDYAFYDGMPYGVKALQFDFPPVRSKDWYVCAIVTGAPAMLTPSTDGRGNSHLSEQIWTEALSHTEQGRAIMAQYDTPYHRRKVMGVTTYNTTIGRTTHKLVGIAVPKSDEGNKIATALLRSCWNESEENPHFFDIAGGMSVTLLPIPSETKHRPAFFKQCIQEAAETIKNTYTVRVNSVSKNIYNSSHQTTIVDKWEDLKYIHVSARYGDSNPGCVLVLNKTETIVQSTTEEIADILYAKSEGMLAPKPKDKSTTERYVQEAQNNINSIRRNKPRSESNSVSFANTDKPPKSSPKSVTDLFISNVQRQKQAKSVFGFPRGRHANSRRPWCCISNAIGGVRSMGVDLWENCEHRVKGCPYALYQNFPTKEEAYQHLYRTCPEAGIKDDESARAVWETVPITATNLDNPYVHIPTHKRNGPGGKMWFEDDDAALLFARQLHTIGHPNYEPDAEIRAHRIMELNGTAPPKPSDAPTSSTASTTPSTDQSSTGPTDDMDDESDDDMPASQVDAYSPADATPTKRNRPNSHTPSANGTYNRNTHTNFILFSVAPFTQAEEFKNLLCEHIVNDAKLLGRVSLVKKKGEDEKFFIAAEMYDISLGQRIIDELSSKDLCHIPLDPHWITAESWAHFFTIYTKASSHGNLEALASSKLITRLKQECPLSHHQQLDELLCSNDNAFEVYETYQSWFGKSTFSPFGNIEPSTF